MQMKKSSLLLPAICLLAVVCVLPCAAQETYNFALPSRDEPIYGTWVNPSYSGWGWANAQKWVFLSWGRAGVVPMVSEENLSYDETFILVEKWAGDGGSTLYKLFIQDKDLRQYYLARVSADRARLEFVVGAGFPDESELTPTNSSYRTFRRQ
jgi:hypothetical protein